MNKILAIGTVALLACAQSGFSYSEGTQYPQNQPNNNQGYNNQGYTDQSYNQGQGNTNYQTQNPRGTDNNYSNRGFESNSNYSDPNRREGGYRGEFRDNRGYGQGGWDRGYAQDGWYGNNSCGGNGCNGGGYQQGWQQPGWEGQRYRQDENRATWSTWNQEKANDRMDNRTDRMNNRMDNRTNNRMDNRTDSRTDNRSNANATNADGQSDSAITENIKQQIARDTTLSNLAQSITVTTKDGNVTLKGNVDNANQKSTIEWLSKNTQGVNDVDSRLVIKR